MNTETTTDRATMEVIDSLNKMSLEMLYGKALDIQNDCEDYMVRNVSELNTRFSPESFSLRFRSEDEKLRERKFTPYSFGQLCTKLEIPARYMDKCIQRGQLHLAENNINTWLDSYGKDFFIRTHKDKIRGVLSDRYMTLDAPDIIQVLSDNVDMNKYQVKGHFLTPERFHARIVDRNPITKKEDLFAGIQIDSSDVGRSTLTVTFFVYKLVCTNGLIAPVEGGVLFSKKHIGRYESEIEDFREGFKTAMKQIPILANEYERLIDKAKNITLTLDNENNQTFYKDVLTKNGLSEEAVEQVFEIRSEKYPDNHWGLINAVTEVAQGFTLERRIEIEKAAGHMLMRVA